LYCAKKYHIIYYYIVFKYLGTIICRYFFVKYHRYRTQRRLKTKKCRYVIYSRFYRYIVALAYIILSTNSYKCILILKSNNLKHIHQYTIYTSYTLKQLNFSKLLDLFVITLVSKENIFTSEVIINRIIRFYLRTVRIYKYEFYNVISYSL